MKKNICHLIISCRNIKCLKVTSITVPIGRCFTLILLVPIILCPRILFVPGRRGSTGRWLWWPRTASATWCRRLLVPKVGDGWAAWLRWFSKQFPSFLSLLLLQVIPSVWLVGFETCSLGLLLLQKGLKLLFLLLFELPGFSFLMLLEMFIFFVMDYLKILSCQLKQTFMFLRHVYLHMNLLLLLPFDFIFAVCFH